MSAASYLTAAHEDFEAGREWIEVVAAPPDEKTKRRFDFQWVDDSYQTRQVAGTLSGLVPGNTGNTLMDIVHPTETILLPERPGQELSCYRVLPANRRIRSPVEPQQRYRNPPAAKLKKVPMMD